MRIAIVAACPVPAPRGTPIRIYRTAEALAERGHDVHLVTYAIGRPECPAPFRIHRTSPRHPYRSDDVGPNYRKLLVMDPLLMRTLDRVIGEHHIDLVHAHHFEGLLASILPCRKHRVPLVFDVHTMLEPELPYYGLGLPTAVKRRIARELDRWLPRFADHVVTVSDELREAMLLVCPIPRDRVSVAVSGVEALPSLNGAASHAKRGYRLIFTGNPAPYQGIDLMLSAFRRIASARKDVTLQIASQAPLESWSQYLRDALYRDRIEFHHVNFDRTVELIQHAHVAFNPRVDCSGVPQKLLNYLAIGVPVVSFEGSAKFVRDGHTALVVPDRNVDAMADAAIRILENEGLGRALRRNGRDLIARELTWDATARTYESIYEHVLAKRTGRPR